MQQWKSDFKRTINWLKYKSNVTIQAPNPYLDYLIDPNFQGVNRAFVLLFENTTDRTVDTTFCLPTLEIENYNVMIDGKDNMITLQKLQLAKEMITRLVVHYITIILVKT